MRSQLGIDLTALLSRVVRCGIDGDGLSRDRVVAIKVEYDTEFEELTIYRIALDRFGDRVVSVPIWGAGGRPAGAGSASDIEHLLAVAMEAWKLAQADGNVPRGLFGPHDSIYMYDLGSGKESVVNWG